MFGNQKPAFGQASNTFGAFNTSTAVSPFGQTSAFGKPATTSAFGGTPAFGATATQPQNNLGLFGQQQAAQPNQPGLFGQQQQGNFGNPQTGFGFGGNTSGGLFGGAPAAGTGGTLFGQAAPAAQGFGAKPAGFGFGNATVGGGLFNTPAASGSGLFAQQPNPAAATNSMPGLFGSAGGFGGQTGTYIKYTPVTSTDVMVKNGHTQTINTLHHCITCMKDYESKSLEELRMEDYAANRRGGAASAVGVVGTNSFGQPNTSAVGQNAFGQPQQQQNTGGLFGQDNKAGVFGQPGFGQPSTSAAGGLFGKPATTGFGGQPAAGGGFSFGGGTAGQQAPLFGAVKPFGAQPVGLFGAGAQPQTSAFASAAQPAQGGFGGFGTPQQTNNLFGAKPATTTAFGMPQTTTAAGFGFGAQNTAQNTGGLFGAPKQNAPFGAPPPAFGAANTGFGAPNATVAGAGSLFGNTSFGQKPATAVQPAFGFNSAAAPNTGLGGGLNLSGGSLFGGKPAGGGLFGGQQQQPGSLFGGGVGGAGTLGLGTGIGGTLGNTGFGGQSGGLGSFGTGTLGMGGNALGGSVLGGGLNMSGSLLGNNTSLGALGGTAASTGLTVHEHMIALVSQPFGDTPLFKNLVPAPGKIDDLLRPTNPLAQKALMESDKFKVSPGITRLRVKPISAMTPLSKKSLFDGLEENDPTIEATLTLKPSVKRLNLRPKQSPSIASAEDQVNDRRTSNNNSQTLNNSNNMTMNNSNSQMFSTREDTGINEVTADSSPLSDKDTPRRSSRHSPNVYQPDEEFYGQENVSFSPTSGNIHRRVGLTDPRGSTLKSPLNVSSIGNTDSDTSERRSSWLASKPLSKWPADDSSAQQRTLDNTLEQLMPGSTHSHYQSTTVSESRVFSSQSPSLGGLSSKRLYPDLASRGLFTNEELNEELERDRDSAEENEKNNHISHPTGIKMTRPGYYTIPSLEELIGYLRPDGSCIVPQFTIGRRGYGNVFYDCEMNVADLNIDQVVHIMNKEITVYPDDDNKPPVGSGLNRRAQVTLDQVWPTDKTLRAPITEPERLDKMDYQGKLRRVSDKYGTKFIEYRPQTGSWVFKVQHFSKYGIRDSDEEDDGAADNSNKPGVVVKPGTSGVFLDGTRGLGGLARMQDNMADLGRMRAGLMLDDNATDVGISTSFTNRLTAVTKSLAMDTSEENSIESAALYPEGSMFGGYKDATSPNMRAETANPHTLQLMKASFYNTTEVNDDFGSVTDQMVPQGISVAGSSIHTARTVSPSLMNEDVQDVTVHHRLDAFSMAQQCKSAVIVKPRTATLRYYKKILPFKETIAGKMDAACFSDLAIANARLFRVGWGVGSQITALNTLDAVNDAPLTGDLIDLGAFVKGRGIRDTSGQVVQRIRVAGGGVATEIGTNFKESIEKYLNISFENSNFVQSDVRNEEFCPRIEPSKELTIECAERYLTESNRWSTSKKSPNLFGIDQKYCKDVWSLCLALWGDHFKTATDMQVDGVCGRDLLTAHAALSDWLMDAVVSSESSNKDRASDEYPSEIVALLAAKKVREACVAAQKRGDYLMAIMISQIGGDSRVRALAAKQLGAFRESNSDRHVSESNLAVLSLLAGKCKMALTKGGSLNVCQGLSWQGSLALHYWYICESVSTVADAIKSFEKSFAEESHAWKINSLSTEGDATTKQLATNADGSEDEGVSEGMMEDFDISTASGDDILRSRVAFPLPPYTTVDDECMKDEDTEKKPKKRVLDLCYQLMALKASRWRSLDTILNPASHTQDPLDYRLSWLLQQFLEGVGYSHWSARGVAILTTGFATQLEAHGLWHWAVYVLQHIKDDTRRNHAVKEVIMRNAGGSENSARRALLTRFKVPKKWIHRAEALYAKYKNDAGGEARHLSLAGEWADAHTVILEKLLPTAILNENTEGIREMLHLLIEPGNAGLIPNWATGGHLFLEFLDIWDGVKSLIGLDMEDYSHRCEGLRPRIAAVCNAIATLQTPTFKHIVARCEVASRLGQVACAVVGDADGRIPRSAQGTLLSIIQRLDLPGDYAIQLLDKVAKSFMESEVTMMS